ncbi:MAG: O-antigen ligase family protein [Sulfurimonas sp.]|uniref:O-antigen ligase family protein n=1 Tax=Sulfurimonas sp. TaxID=2022749 RepID=UPI0026210448|nr:O-antigen ligase family protein [Sulfurimonas sp.]MDD3476819.1 O-antigen ligase family protein [Sulfurimonas sp.]
MLKLISNKFTTTYNDITLSKTINYAIILLAFSIPLSKALTSGVEVLIIVLWLFNKNIKEKINIAKRNNLISAIALFLTFSAISLLWSNDTLYALNYLKKYWHFLLIPIIYTSFKKEYLHYIFSAFLTSMFISELISYGIFFELFKYKNISPMDPSPFMGHTDYSSYLAFTAFILIYRILSFSSFIYKIPYILFLISSVSNLFMNGGRTGQVIFLMSILIIGFLHIKNKAKALVGMFILIVLIFITAYNTSSVFSKRMDYTLSDINMMVKEDNYTNSFSARIALWGIGVKNSMHEPLFGTGIGDEALHSSQDVQSYGLGYFISKKDNFNYVDYHNAFVQYLVQLGIIGFILLLNIFYRLYKLKIQSYPYRELKILFIFLYIMWSLIGLTIHLNNSLLFFVLFVSIFLVVSKEETLQKKPCIIF